MINTASSNCPTWHEIWVKSLLNVQSTNSQIQKDLWYQVGIKTLLKWRGEAKGTGDHVFRALTNGVALAGLAIGTLIDTIGCIALGILASIPSLILLMAVPSVRKYATAPDTLLAKIDGELRPSPFLITCAKLPVTLLGRVEKGFPSTILFLTYFEYANFFNPNLNYDL